MTQPTEQDRERARQLLGAIDWRDVDTRGVDRLAQSYAEVREEAEEDYRALGTPPTRSVPPIGIMTSEAMTERLADPDFAADEEILKGAEERAQKATPGPWQDRFIYRLFSAARKNPDLLLGPDNDWDDSAFIAAARTDVPVLAAIARKYQRALKVAMEALARASELEVPEAGIASWGTVLAWITHGAPDRKMGVVASREVVRRILTGCPEAAAEVRRILEGGEEGL